MRRRQACRAGAALAIALALLLGAGCATVPRHPVVVREGYRGLRDVPAPALAEHGRADQEVVDAFFAAYGAPLGPEELGAILRAGAPLGRIESKAFRRAARARKLLPLVVEADEAYLWNALGEGEVLLLVLPESKAWSRAAPLAIPVAWNREEGWIELYGPVPATGLARISSLEFFARREPLSQAAIKLCRPEELGKDFDGNRASQLVLADFWFDQGNYRKADALYASVAEDDAPGDAQGLVGRGNVLVKRGKYAEAAEFYRKALELEPDSPRIHNNLAYALLQSGDGLLTALRHARIARDADPANPIYLETVGSINLALGDATLAAKTLEYAWARALKYPESIQVAIMDQLTRAWLAAGNEVLAWEVASYRVKYHSSFKVPKDILRAFPALKKLPLGEQPEKLTVK